MKVFKAKPGAVLWLGRRGEDDARAIAFDLSWWQEQYGAGRPELLVQRPGEGYRYPVVLTVEGNQAYWHVSEADTDIPGSTGSAELRYYTVDGNMKSVTWRTEILESKDSPIGTAPAPYQDWVDQVLRAGTDTAANAQAAAASEQNAAQYAGRAESAAIHQPIIQNGTWWTWDIETGKYVDTGVAASGGGGGGISVEDDGAGNVEITALPGSWTVTDDGNGNVVIGG